MSIQGNIFDVRFALQGNKGALADFEELVEYIVYLEDIQEKAGALIRAEANVADLPTLRVALRDALVGK